jgi:transcription elongation factor Elf1
MINLLKLSLIGDIMVDKHYHREYYRKNAVKRQEQNKKWKMKVRKWYQDYKKTLKCEKCNETHTTCLEFHHVKGKDGTISNMVSGGYSVDRIKKEMAKCIVLCANCHRKEHYEKG